ALRTGEIDVASWHGRPQDVFDRGGVRVLFDDYDVWKTVGGATPYYTREDFIKKNPEAVRGFVNAITRANNWINANREEAKKIQAKRTGVKPEQVQVLYYAPDGIIKEDSIQQWIDIMLDYGEIKEPIDPKLVFTNEFNRFYNEKSEK
ncbi:MAG: ABC transporter substrate-binding protein, partial [Synergistaceae bacterium]|nr:ABC transporter substrate-binding protein [Synergistaceae bacterium]